MCVRVHFELKIKYINKIVFLRSMVHITWTIKIIYSIYILLFLDSCKKIIAEYL